MTQDLEQRIEELGESVMVLRSLYKGSNEQRLWLKAENKKLSGDLAHAQNIREQECKAKWEARGKLTIATEALEKVVDRWTMDCHLEKGCTCIRDNTSQALTKIKENDEKEK